MKTAKDANVPAQAVRAEQLDKINRYTRRALQAEEVYVFSLVLCDNEVDRDLERFDDAALEKLAALFVGKTGVFDHAARAENQSARLFDAQVEETPGQRNSLGQPYRCVRAWAYMARSAKNRELIFEIDAGIKKEVSVSCAVRKTVCSVCGRDVKAESCTHEKGESYAGALCHHILTEPTDAYEWSFVAVPAQQKAGVTKRHGTDGRASAKVYTGPVELAKLFAEQGDVLLTGTQRGLLAKERARLEAQAQAGRAYLDGLRRDVVKSVLLAQPAMEPEVIREMADGMDERQLLAFRKAFAAGLEERYPMPQLGGGPRGDRNDEAVKAFKL